tara:strand:- start:1686 stop:1892 length:207 start_codon:yes stop_codon:yes gene_type:complete
MKLEYFLLVLLLGGLFSLVVVIPVAFVFGVWNFGIVHLFPTLPKIGVMLSFLIYGIILATYSFIKSKN